MVLISNLESFRWSDNPRAAVEKAQSSKGYSAPALFSRVSKPLVSVEMLPLVQVDFMPDKTKIELSVFAEFCDAADLPLLRGAAEKRDPPEPDLLCEIDSERVAFELVEIADEALQRRTLDQLDLERLLAAERSARVDRLANLRDALVLVSFDESASIQMRRSRVGLIVDELERIEEIFVGKRRPESVKLTNVVDFFDISRNQPRLTIGVDAAGSYGDPTIPTILKKLTKNYQASYPLELLAYYESQPSHVSASFRPDLDSLRPALAASQFRRVWIFDGRSAQVCKID